MSKDLASIVMKRIEALGRVSDEPGHLTRTFCSPGMRRANALVGSWMRAAGMSVRQDAIGNVIGHYAPKLPKPAKTLVFGSHLDTVRDAGKFDGPLGVLTAIACVQHLQATRTELPFTIEVVGFCDEEGVRYQSTYLGSKVLAGTFSRADLKRKDANGVMMADAIRKFGGKPAFLPQAKLNPTDLLGYVEVHIEQGPVLESQNLSVAVVSAIAGQTRAHCRFVGLAGHAGTVPMKLRNDALCAAAEFVLAVEAIANRTKGLVATVGQISAFPGASNVIAGEATLSLDVRHANDATRNQACAAITAEARRMAKARQVDFKIQTSHQARSVVCDAWLSKVLAQNVQRHQRRCISLPSGAGHDAAAMAAITPVAMLFVRCKGGISHHPAESVSLRDIRMAIVVMNNFLQQLARHEGL